MRYETTQDWMSKPATCDAAEFSQRAHACMQSPRGDQEKNDSGELDCRDARTNHWSNHQRWMWIDFYRQTLHDG